MDKPFSSFKKILENRTLADYHLSSDDTVSFFLPLLLRAANTRRPLGVDIRSRKPCLFLRLRCDG